MSSTDPELDLASAEFGASLRRIAAVAERGGRACAWALTTFGDERRATAALVTSAHLDRARTSLDHVATMTPEFIRPTYVARWQQTIARLEALLAEKSPDDPSPPGDLNAWILTRVGLELDSDPRVPGARKMGVRPAHVVIARHRGDRTDEALADAAAIAADAFPIGEGWVPTERDVAIRETGEAISRHLAYTSHRYQTQEVGEQRIRTFLQLFLADARLFLNGTRSGNARFSQPPTLSTFDFGMAVVDRERVGVVIRTGED